MSNFDKNGILPISPNKGPLGGSFFVIFVEIWLLGGVWGGPGAFFGLKMDFGGIFRGFRTYEGVLGVLLAINGLYWVLEVIFDFFDLFRGSLGGSFYLFCPINGFWGVIIDFSAIWGSISCFYRLLAVLKAFYRGNFG